MRRVLRNLGVEVSLLLCIAATGLWVRSYFRLDDIAHVGRWHIHNFCSQRGRIFIQWGWSRRDEIKRSEFAGFDWQSTSSPVDLTVEIPPLATGRLRLLLLEVNRKTADGLPVAGERVFIFPWRFVVAMTGVAPVMAARRFLTRLRRERRSRRGQCSNCGYDLRATVGRCPECGAEPELR